MAFNPATFDPFQFARQGKAYLDREHPLETVADIQALGETLIQFEPVWFALGNGTPANNGRALLSSLRAAEQNARTIANDAPPLATNDPRYIERLAREHGELLGTVQSNRGDAYNIDQQNIDRMRGRSGGESSVRSVWNENLEEINRHISNRANVMDIPESMSGREREVLERRGAEMQAQIDQEIEQFRTANAPIAQLLG